MTFPRLGMGSGPRAVLLAAAVVVAACGSCGSGGETPRTSESSGTTTSTAGAALPGERVEIYPYRGARLAVVGVADGDTLAVRSGPGTDFDVRFELEPLATDATATGHNRSVSGAGSWSEITARGRTGWAKTSFLLQPGEVRDLTGSLFPTPGERPEAETLRELGELVGGLLASDEPPSDVVVVDEPDGGEPTEITVDIIGFGDDAQGGERLRVRAEPGRDGEGFTVRTVEGTALCSRGVSDDGLCV